MNFISLKKKKNKQTNTLIENVYMTLLLGSLLSFASLVKDKREQECHIFTVHT